MSFNAGMIAGLLLLGLFHYWVVSDCVHKAGEDGHCEVALNWPDWQSGIMHFTPVPPANQEHGEG